MGFFLNPRLASCSTWRICLITAHYMTVFTKRFEVTKRVRGYTERCAALQLHCYWQRREDLLKAHCPFVSSRGKPPRNQTSSQMRLWYHQSCRLLQLWGSFSFSGSTAQPSLIKKKNEGVVCIPRGWLTVDCSLREWHIQELCEWHVCSSVLSFWSELHGPVSQLTWAFGNSFKSNIVLIIGIVGFEKLQHVWSWVSTRCGSWCLSSYWLRPGL